MSTDWIVVGLSLAAACAFAFSTSLKHVSAGQVPDAQNMHPRSLVRFVRATVSHRWWLAGMCCDVIGLSLQILALHLGELSVVQPLLLSSLLFALIIRGRFENQPIARRQWLWALVLIGTLAGFVLLATSPASAVDEAADPFPAAFAGAMCAVLVIACLLISRRQTGRFAAALLGVGVGIIYAMTAALIKAATTIAARRPVDLLTHWPLYAIIALGAAGLLLSQLTFQAGPLTASLPATATVDPLLSVIIGVAVFDEHLRQGGRTDTLLVILLVLLGTAVIQLSRTAAYPPATA